MESFLTDWGYAALILFGFLEAACIPISSEITFGFAGVLAYQGHLNLALVIIVGTLAELAGSYASYYVGRRGGRPLVHKLGRYVLVTESDVARAERFLEGRGAWAIPVGRMLPFARAFISIVAGLVRVPAGRFGVLSLIGTVIYATALSSIGYALGSAWERLDRGQHGRARGGRVLDGEHPPPGHVRALDPALGAVLLVLLPHHERVHRRAPGGRGVHHRGGHRVGAQGESPDRVVGQVRGQVEHDPPGQRRHPPVQQD